METKIIYKEEVPLKVEWVGIERKSSIISDEDEVYAYYIGDNTTANSIHKLSFRVEKKVGDTNEVIATLYAIFEKYEGYTYKYESNQIFDLATEDLVSNSNIVSPTNTSFLFEKKVPSFMPNDRKTLAFFNEELSKYNINEAIKRIEFKDGTIITIKQQIDGQLDEIERKQTFGSKRKFKALTNALGQIDIRMITLNYSVDGKEMQFSIRKSEQTWTAYKGEEELFSIEALYMNNFFVQLERELVKHVFEVSTFRNE